MSLTHFSSGSPFAFHIGISVNLLMVYDSKKHRNRQSAWLKKVDALLCVPKLVRRVWQTNRVFSIAILALRILGAFNPIASLWIGKLIIDVVVAGRAGTPDYNQLGKLVAIEVCIVVAGQVIIRASSVYETLLAELFSNRTSVLVMEHAATLDLRNFEDPVFYDRLERARRQTTGRVILISQLLQMCEDALSLASLSLALLVYSPWLLLLLAIAVVPSFLGETHFAKQEYLLRYGWTPGRRKLDYLLYLGASNQSAKEVQLFGLASWIIARFRSLAGQFYEDNRKLTVRKNIIGAALSCISVAGYYAAYVIILMRTIRGAITIGSLSFLATSFQRSRDLIQRLLMCANTIYEQSLFLKDLFDFFEMKPSITSPPGAPVVPKTVLEGVVFENVGFKYPDTTRWAVRHVNLKIHPGERVAFVGENGAGKTTLTKLLARLYDVTEGRILLDGKDIRDYDIQSVRRAIGVIFQDFGRYDLLFQENIGIGEIDKVKSYLDHVSSDKQSNGKASDAGAPKSPETRKAQIPGPILSAAEKSLASSLLPRLPQGYQQMLGRRFEGGMELSGGEWQKIALARAYMRDAQLLILDEPTASLDARAEYEVFIRFSKLVAGRIAVIISHRFSTVRMADRIIVLKDGAVVEEGTHHELVESRGLYADLFELQAEGYR